MDGESPYLPLPLHQLSILLAKMLIEAFLCGSQDSGHNPKAFTLCQGKITQNGEDQDDGISIASATLDDAQAPEGSIFLGPIFTQRVSALIQSTPWTAFQRSK